MLERSPPDSLNDDLLAEISSTYASISQVASDVPSDEDLDIESGHVMVIDDEAINIKLVRKVLQDVGFVRFSDVTDSRVALSEIRSKAPDVILLDIMMPHISGLEILEAVRATSQLKHVPIIILTASSDRDTRLAALQLGATDFLTKPVDRCELIPRVRNALTVKAYHDHFRDQSIRLEETVRQRTEEVVASRLEVVQCLARAAELHDDITGKHIVRVGRYAGVIGRELGLSIHETGVLELAAQLHDVGKIGIPDAILRKAGDLTSEEFAIVARHCQIGKQVFDHQNVANRAIRVDQIDTQGTGNSPSTGTPLIRMAARIAFTHHEHWDGTGYPLGLSGEEIPLEGRITAVADVYDALSCQRPYKPAFSIQRCFDMLEEGRGTQFDPTVLDAFLRRRDEIIGIQFELADTVQRVLVAGGGDLDSRNGMEL